MKLYIATLSVCLASILVSCTRIQETNVDFGSKTFVNEYKTLTDAVNDLRVAVTSQTTSLELKLAAIETAIQAQTVEVKAGDELIKTAIETLDASVKAGTVSEQEALEQIKAAMDSQTSALGTKLAAISATAETGFASLVAAEGLIKDAIAALDESIQAGTLSEAEALAQIQSAIQSQSTDFCTKLAAIEAAIQAQTIEIKAGDELIKTAIETLDASVKAGTLSEEKALGQLRAAVESQTSTLSTKLSAIEAANAIGFADIVTAEGLVRSAISSLSSNVRTGFITEKQALKQIEGAVNYQTGTLFVSLSAIDATNRQGFASLAWVESQIKAAIQELSYSVKVSTITENHALDQIKQAVNGQTFTLSTNLMLIKSSIDFGLMNVAVAEQMVKDAVYALKASVDAGNFTEMYALDQIKQAVNSQTFALSTNLMLIKSSIDFGLMNVAVAEQMVKDAVYALKASVDVGNVTEMYALDQIKQAVNSQTFALSTNLMLIKSSIDFGLMNVTVAEQMVKDALVSFMGSNDQKLGQILTALSELQNHSDENTTKITDILKQTTYDNGIDATDFPSKIKMTKNAYESMKSESAILGAGNYCATEKALIDHLNFNVKNPKTDQREFDKYPTGEATGHSCFTATMTTQAPAEIIGYLSTDTNYYEVYKTREWVEYKFTLKSSCSWPYLKMIEIKDANGTTTKNYNDGPGGTWQGIKVYHYVKDSSGQITKLCEEPHASAWCSSQK